MTKLVDSYTTHLQTDRKAFKYKIVMAFDLGRQTFFITQKWSQASTTYGWFGTSTLSQKLRTTNICLDKIVQKYIHKDFVFDSQSSVEFTLKLFIKLVSAAPISLKWL